MKESGRQRVGSASAGMRLVDGRWVYSDRATGSGGWGGGPLVIRETQQEIEAQADAWAERGFPRPASCDGHGMAVTRAELARLARDPVDGESVFPGFGNAHTRFRHEQRQKRLVCCQPDTCARDCPGPAGCLRAALRRSAAEVRMGSKVIKVRLAS